MKRRWFGGVKIGAQLLSHRCSLRIAAVIMLALAIVRDFLRASASLW